MPPKKNTKKNVTKKKVTKKKVIKKKQVTKKKLKAEVNDDTEEPDSVINDSENIDDEPEINDDNSDSDNFDDEDDEEEEEEDDEEDDDEVLEEDDDEPLDEVRELFLEDYDLLIKEKNISKGNRLNNNKLSNYERTRIIGTRATQISRGSKPFIKNYENLSPIEIANQELNNFLVPIKLVRPMPNGTKEVWSISEFK